MRFKIDWANLVVGSKFSVFALFYFVFEGNFLSTSPWEAYIWRGDLTEGFFCVTGLGGLYLEGLTFGFTVFLLISKKIFFGPSGLILVEKYGVGPTLDPALYTTNLPS